MRRRRTEQTQSQPQPQSPLQRTTPTLVYAARARRPVWVGSGHRLVTVGRLVSPDRKGEAAPSARTVMQRRLDRAQHLIRRNTPLAEVALMLGFTDQSHFTKAFSAAFGTTPSRWVPASA